MHCGIHQHVCPEALANADIVILVARPKHNTAAYSLEEGLGTIAGRAATFTCSPASCSPSSPACRELWYIAGHEHKEVAIGPAL